MLEIITLLSCLTSALEPTTLRQLSRLVVAMLSMNGRVTMRGLARWGGVGASYRTVQRLYHTTLPWGQLMWLLFRHRLYRPGEEYLLVGDESVVTKAGHATYGLDRFFSSIYQRSVPGLSFFTLSVVGVQEGLSHPLLVEQVVRESPSSEQDHSTNSTKPKGGGPQGGRGPKGGGPKGGRPQGSKNKDKTQIEWTPELRRLARMAQQLLKFSAGLLGLRYLVLDGHFGNNNVLQMVRQELGLHGISKLRADSALHFPYAGVQKPLGRDRCYGAKVDYRALPAAYRVAQVEAQGIVTEVYQATLLHACFAAPLNVVILVKTNLKSRARAHVVLFSSDRELPWEKLVRAYRLRFQIEFNFRDAKQFWGLEDFMNVAQTAVTNAANFSFFMVNLAHCLLERLRERNPQAGVLDLKAYWRGRHYAQVALKLLVPPPTPVLMEQIMEQLAQQGAIHAPSAACSTA